MLSKNIIIIGIAGVGKTTVSKLLSARLKKEFIDLDKNIEVHCGVDINTIFAIEGEIGFRKRESIELKSVINNKNNYVLSIGGGAIIANENRLTIIKSNSLIIQLFANIDVIIERLKKYPDKRPILTINMEQKIAELYSVRKPLYDETSDYNIDTSILKPNQVVEQILYFWDKN